MSLADVALLSCTKSKASHQMQAGDLYTSTWFRMARSWAEQNADQWFILSAEYGLVDPLSVIAPYEATLTRKSAAERIKWGRRVEKQMDGRGLCGRRVFVLAGTQYREVLFPHLRARFSKIEIPMKGLRFGQQLHWLSQSA